MSGLGTPHPDRDRLAAFGGGALDDLECARVEKHLAACAPCLATLEALPEDPLACLIRGAVASRDGSPLTLQLGDLAPPPLRGGPAAPGLRLHPGYEVLREIGRGGMGAVYLARQVGLNRVVALKKIRPDAHLDPDQQARFRREAEAVAKLGHPNIVQVYEVGEQDGQSYLALEYLDGGTLAEKLTGPLPPREAAGLTLALARAIDHAHQRGIVHRDLKPANVLLASPPPGVDAAGLAGAVVKVADFGLAKDLTRELGQTRTGAIVGTPDYMAPEQAAGLAREIGPPADIWALGAILYECLTGRPPFRGATTLDTLQLVRQQEPVPPSRLQPKVPRDLETACLKCLEKEPRRRYGTAAALAEDLRRYLAGEPILARRVGPVVQLAKWARRKPAAAALAVACVTFVTLAAAGAGWHYRSLSAALKRAEQSEALTRAQYREATATIHQMFGKAADRRMRPIPQLSELQEAQAAAALRFFEQAAREGGGLAAEARRDLALVSNQAANFQRNLGRNVEAERNARRAVELLESVIRENPHDNEARGWLVYSHVCLGAICTSERRWDEAESLLRRGVELAEALCRDEPRGPAFKGRLREAYHNLGNLLVLNRRPAVEWFEKAAAISRELLQGDPRDYHSRLYLADDCSNLWQAYHLAGQPEKAAAALREAFTLLDALARENPADAAVGYSLGGVLIKLGASCLMRGRLDEALAEYTKCVAVLERALKHEPNDAGTQQFLLTAQGSRAECLTNLKRYSEARAEWEKYIAMPGAMGNVDFRLTRAVTLIHLGEYEAGTKEVDAVAGLGKGNGLLLYNCACAFALSAKAPGAAEARAARAVALLEAARAAGHFKKPANVAHLKQDADLEPLRGRKDYQALLRAIE